MTQHLYALSKLGKKIYERVDAGWAAVANQPPLSGTSGSLLLADEDGDLIVYDGPGKGGEVSYPGIISGNTYSSNPRNYNTINNFTVSGDYLAFGVPDSGYNKVRVYKRDGTSWSLLRTISYPGVTADPSFGNSVCFDGSDLLVSSPVEPSNIAPPYYGAVYVYGNYGETLKQTIYVPQWVPPPYPGFFSTRIEGVVPDPVAGRMMVRLRWISSWFGGIGYALLIYEKDGNGVWQHVGWSTESSGWQDTVAGYNGAYILTDKRNAAAGAVKLIRDVTWTEAYSFTPSVGYNVRGSALRSNTLAILEYISPRTLRLHVIELSAGVWSETSMIEWTYSSGTATDGSVAISSDESTIVVGVFGRDVRSFTKGVGGWALSKGPLAFTTYPRYSSTTYFAASVATDGGWAAATSYQGMHDIVLYDLTYVAEGGGFRHYDAESRQWSFAPYTLPSNAYTPVVGAAVSKSRAYIGLEANYHYEASMLEWDGNAWTGSDITALFDPSWGVEIDAMAATADGEVWIAGTQAVLHYKDGNWTNRVGEVAAALGVYADSNFDYCYSTAVWISPTGKVYVAASGTRSDGSGIFITGVVVLDNGTWSIVGTVFEGAYYGWSELAGRSDDDIYLFSEVLASNGEIYHWTSSTWALEHNFGSDDYTALWGTGADFAAANFAADNRLESGRFLVTADEGRKLLAYSTLRGWVEVPGPPGLATADKGTPFVCYDSNARQVFINFAATVDGQPNITHLAWMDIDTGEWTVRTAGQHGVFRYTSATYGFGMYNTFLACSDIEDSGKIWLVGEYGAGTPRTMDLTVYKDLAVDIPGFVIKKYRGFPSTYHAWIIGEAAGVPYVIHQPNYTTWTDRTAAVKATAGVTTINPVDAYVISGTVAIIASGISAAASSYVALWSNNAFSALGAYPAFDAAIDLKGITEQSIGGGYAYFALGEDTNTGQALVCRRLSGAAVWSRSDLTQPGVSGGTYAESTDVITVLWSPASVAVVGWEQTGAGPQVPRIWYSTDLSTYQTLDEPAESPAWGVCQSGWLRFNALRESVTAPLWVVAVWPDGNVVDAVASGGVGAIIVVGPQCLMRARNTGAGDDYVYWLAPEPDPTGIYYTGTVPWSQLTEAICVLTLYPRVGHLMRARNTGAGASYVYWIAPTPEEAESAYAGAVPWAQLTDIVSASLICTRLEN